MKIDRAALIEASGIMKSNPLWLYIMRQRDRAYQGLMNNLYSNNPGEIDRWADDGGRHAD